MRPARSKNTPSRPSGAKRKRRMQTGNLFARALDIPKDLSVALLRRLYVMRMAGERLAELNPAAAPELRGSEAIVVGACAALQPGDLVATVYPSPNLRLAQGLELPVLLAELTGRAETGGNAAGLRLIEIGAQGERASLALGAAFACQAGQKRQAVLCFLHDAAETAGAVHETLHLAAHWKLPLVFVCEHRAGLHHRVPLLTHAQNCGIEAVRCDGANVLEVQETAAAACAKARAGNGPALIEAKLSLQNAPAPTAGKAMREVTDPIGQFRVRLLEAEVLTAPDALKQEHSARKEVDAAFRTALRKPMLKPAASRAHE